MDNVKAQKRFTILVYGKISYMSMSSFVVFFSKIGIFFTNYGAYDIISAYRIKMIKVVLVALCSSLISFNREFAVQ